MPELDDEFAEAFGVPEGGIQKLREEVQANMTRELEDGLRARAKQRVFDALVEATPFELPASMVKNEAQRMANERAEELKRYGLDPSTMGQDASTFESEAESRVRLGLVVGALIEEKELRADPAEVRERIERMASTYQEPEEVLRWYYSDEQRLNQIESAVLEDQVSDWLLEQMQVTDEPQTFDQVMNRTPAE